MVDLSNVLWLEYSVLGTVLQFPEHTGEVVAKLGREHFSTEHTKGIYDAISSLHLEGNPVDRVTVLRKAGSEYEVPVLEIAQYGVSPSSLDYYCNLLQDQGRLQQLQTEALGMTSAENLEQAAKVLERMNGLLVTQRKSVLRSITDAVTGFYQRQESTEKPEYLSWGFKELNDALFVELGDFVIVGGYSSSGKTLLSLQFALELARRYRVGYFSLETYEPKLTDRIMSHMAQVPLGRIKKRELSDTDWAAVAEASGKLRELQLTIIRSSAMSVRDIQAVTLNQRFEVIVVDYLQLVADNSNGSIYERVSNISKGLHTLAQSNQVAVIALAQLSRPDKEKGKPQPPSMHSFRDSGQIEQDADVAMLIWPADPNDNRSNRILKVAKNKEGEKLKLELAFDGATQTLSVAQPSRGEQFRKLQSEIRKAGRPPEQQMTFTELGGDEPIPF